ncbi:diguanylate phosphodiesterase [Desulforamulus reducens MI-1]|uniref:Diguanylate phosphodiesterase n=1 Tax=Desulforamulus reducens (strain ATCC BAA-1160 / DSM 100696 / MI-1) TaxID=349161 RepID=A4J2S1_DESRM|nr:EAL domain-containing protein [Desulforamulus reducens]ABO49374.1 diguanylate phosphodiesterase [Desulforamulus reducens MI-1]
MDDVTRILRDEKVSIVFQPINDLKNNSTYAYEALARGPMGGNLYYPTSLFSVAQKLGKIDEIDLLCVKKALQESEVFPKVKLFINVRPATLLNRSQDIFKLLPKGRNIVLEVAEIGLGVKMQKELIRVVRELKEYGIKIALDDIGAGDRNFTNLCEIPADFLKIDKCIIQGLTKFKNGSAPHYLALLKALNTVSRELGAMVITEGVETPLQLQIVRDAGIRLVQGFLISHPKPAGYWIKNRRDICASGSRYL